MDLPAHVTSFGDELLAFFAAAVGLPSVGRVWVQYAGVPEAAAMPLPDHPTAAWAVLSNIPDGGRVLVAPPEVTAAVGGGAAPVTEAWRHPGRSRLRWHHATIIATELVPVGPSPRFTRPPRRVCVTPFAGHAA